MSLLKRKLIISSFVFLSFSSLADDDHIIREAGNSGGKDITGQINFNGKITGSSCEIIQKDVDVDMGEHSVLVLEKSGDTTEPVLFNISVTKCSLFMNSLKIKMEGAAHEGNAGLYALDGKDGSARNVGISITSKDGEKMTPGKVQPIKPERNSRDYTLEYSAVYQATGPVIPGTGNATVNYTVSYL